ncbi:MAG: radical SAM protein [Desulfobacteraceae bacterium]|nr:radical SAM protein [Desulfobacteraceae bacterium]MBU4002612.1 radical SAM protein [Pseudomonadota bacterium]MBU4052811.1 radical SAM protein [Pseudomonadota bacterium]
MHYEGNIIRPPSEADSILLQITVGCSHNKCTFCSANENRRFKIKSDEIIAEDIAFAAQYCKRQDRLFLCDRDALIVPQKRLEAILLQIQKKLPRVTRIGTYANAKALAMKSADELKTLKDLGLGIAYMGLESGDDVTLAHVQKGADSRKMIEMGKKAMAAGIKLSVTVLLGLGGKERTEIHARETGRVLTSMDPDFVGALSLMLIPGTPLFREAEAGRFHPLNVRELLEELKIMIEHTHMTHGMFTSNHASNYLPIRAQLPKEKGAVLRLINKALEGKVSLRSEWMRGL